MINSIFTGHNVSIYVYVVTAMTLTGGRFCYTKALMEQLCIFVHIRTSHVLQVYIHLVLTLLVNLPSPVNYPCHCMKLMFSKVLSAVLMQVYSEIGAI